MKKQQTFIIQKQVFEISAASSATDLEWQSFAAAYFRDFISPAMDECLRNLPVADRHLVIDKLEIDLGALTRAGLEKEGAKRIADELDKLLRALLQKYNGDVYTGFNPGQTGKKNEQDAGGAKPAAKLMSKQEARLKALLYFLQHGRFPWWYTGSSTQPVKDGADISNDTLATTDVSSRHLFDKEFNTDWLLSLGENELLQLKETLQSSEAVCIRFVNHFSADWIFTCLTLLWLVPEKIREIWTLTAPVIAAVSGAGALYHQYFWKSILENPVKGEISIITLLEKTAAHQTGSAVQLARALYSVCSKMENNKLAQTLAVTTASYLAEKNEPGAEGIAHIPDEIESITRNTPSENDTAAANRRLVEQALKEIFQPHAGDDTKNGFGEEDALFIPAAGIVLLHPFLEELFRETDLWDKNQWVNAGSAYRAIQLLSCLVYGKTAMPEQEQLFFKILTGVDIEAPLPAAPPLTEKEINACMELLNAVIHHWKALRNTSAGGLQEGFLQRQGKITRSAKGYQLTVERLAQDILLAQLPWGYSMIKLPWMDDMLNVTWI